MAILKSTHPSLLLLWSCMFMCVVSSDACSFAYRWMDTVMVEADLNWREMKEDLLGFYSITLVRINTVAGKHCSRRSLPRVAPYIASLHMVLKQKEADLLFICLGLYKPNEVKKKWKGLRPALCILFRFYYAHRFSPWIIERWVLWFSRERFCFLMVRDTQCLLSALRFLIFTVPLFIFGLFCSAHQHLVMNYTTYSGTFCIKHSFYSNVALRQAGLDEACQLLSIYDCWRTNSHYF